MSKKLRLITLVCVSIGGALIASERLISAAIDWRSVPSTALVAHYLDVASRDVTSALDSSTSKLRKDTIVATVNWNAVEGTNTPLGFGLNAFQGFRAETFNNQTYKRNLRFMNLGLVRFHNAGALQDSSTPDGLVDTARKTWDVNKLRKALAASFSAFGTAQPQRMINVPTWPDWMDANKDGFLDRNQFDNYAQFCANLVKIVNKDSRFNVKYWEVTNEKDDQYFTEFRDNGGWGGLKNASRPDRLNELITIYNKVAIAMKKVDPTIQVGGPSIARSDLQPFYVPFIKGTVNNLDFFTYHYYATGSASTPDEDIYKAADAIGSRTKTMVQTLKSASPRRSIPIMLSEYNISWTWETRDPRMTNHKGVVFDALNIVSVLKNGATATLAWNEKDGVYGKMDDQSKLRLSGNFFRLSNQFLVGDRVTSTTNHENAVTTLAVNNRTSRYRSYLIINRSSQPRPIQMNFRGWQPSQQTVERHEISASGYSNQRVNWNAITKSLTTPADSVTLLVFPG